VIAAHLARRHAEYSSVLVLLAGVLFGFGLIAGWVALCGAGIVLTAEEVFARRTSLESEQARETALGRS
jgi:Zn-dependent protease with chaperone function